MCLERRHARWYKPSLLSRHAIHSYRLACQDGRGGEQNATTSGLADRDASNGTLGKPIEGLTHKILAGLG